MTQTQTYIPPESFPLDLPPPYSISDPITQSQSDDADVFPPDSSHNDSDLD